MNSRNLPLWMVCFPLVLAACGERRELRVEDYDQVCAKNEDCATVLIGDPCECECDTAAINKGAVDEYTADVTKLKGECLEKAAQCAKCPELKPAVCKDDKCEVESGPVAQ